jgi:hypothetical protein
MVQLSEDDEIKAARVSVKALPHLGKYWLLRETVAGARLASSCSLDSLKIYTVLF